MRDHEMHRRHFIGLGVGAAAGAIGIPRILSAMPNELQGRSAALAAKTDLEVALAAARWIRASRIEVSDGVVWPADPRDPKTVGLDLYNGFPGVILFHLELFHATGDHAWLDEAKAGADALAARLPELDGAKAAGLYDGLAGAAFVLEETHRASGDGRYRDAAKSAIAMIHAQAQKTANGASWSGASAANDVISGTAGIGLFLLWADRTIGDPASRTLALLAGRHLLDAGTPSNGGMKWNVSPDTKNLYPNFSHGTAGVAFFLATLLQATGDRSFMAAALSGARYLESVANTERGGFKVFHHEPGGEQLYYLSWCHGPAGTARLFHRLAQVTQRPRWEQLVKEAAKATIDSGVPEQQSAGYWNNISQCCGNCGVGEFFIALQSRSPDPAYARMIDRVRTNTLARATEVHDGLEWVQAENRVSPQAVVAQTGYMQGAAGVGAFYLHADALVKGRKRAIEWPDSAELDPCAATVAHDPSDMSYMAGAKGCGR
jgi:lantibiotic modifying enzyme